MRARVIMAAIALLAVVIGATTWVSMGASPAADPAILRTIPLPGQPATVAIDGRTGHVFVTVLNTRSIHGGVGRVTMLSAVSGRLLRASPSGANPWTMALAVRSARLFVVNSGQSGSTYPVSVLDTRSGAVVRTVTVTGVRPTAAVVDERAGRVFIVNGGALNRAGTTPVGRGSVSMLDSASGAVLHTTGVGVNPGAVAVDERTARIFVVNSGATFTGMGSVSVLNAASGTVLRTVTVGRAAGQVAVDERTGRVFVSTGNAVYMLDAWSGRVLHSIPVRGGPLTVDEHDGRVYVVDRVDGTVRILDAHRGTLLRTSPRVVPKGDIPVGVAVNEHTRRVIVISDNADGGSVSVLDARTGTLRRTLALGSDPAAVASDARTGRVFVAYAGDGTLRAAQVWRLVPSWLRWLPFLPQPAPPKAPGSVSVVDTSRL